MIAWSKAQSAEDAERDRAHHPARGDDARLPARDRDPACRIRLYSVEVAKTGTPVAITVLVALLVCLIPTTIGGLPVRDRGRGHGRMMRANVIATSGRAVEAAGDCDVLLLDKDRDDQPRQPAGLVPAPGLRRHSATTRRGDAARIAGRRDARGQECRRVGRARVRDRAAAARAGPVHGSSRSRRRPG